MAASVAGSICQPPNTTGQEAFRPPPEPTYFCKLVFRFGPSPNYAPGVVSIVASRPNFAPPTPCSIFLRLSFRFSFVYLLLPSLLLHSSTFPLPSSFILPRSFFLNYFFLPSFSLLLHLPSSSSSSSCPPC